MKLEGSRTVYQTFDVSDYDIKKLVIRVIQDICDIPPSPTIKDGILHEVREEHDHKSYWVEEEVRKATKLDKAALLVLEKIKINKGL